MRKIKFRVTDDDELNNDDDIEYFVEKVADDDDVTSPSESKVNFTEDEIFALKLLATKANDLIELLTVEAKEHAATEESLEKNDIDEVYDESPEEVEEHVELPKKWSDDENCKTSGTHDARKAFGSIATCNSFSNSDAISQDIDTAWAKRYGGK